jgi:hypothetical protein
VDLGILGGDMFEEFGEVRAAVFKVVCTRPNSPS